MNKKKTLGILISVIIVVSGSIAGLVIFLNNGANLPKQSFISVWDTSNIAPSSSGNNQVKLPLEQNGTYNFTVNWGDNKNNTITSWNQAEVTHTYASQGNYTVSITGTLIGWTFNSYGDRLKLINIKQWGDLKLGNSGNYFSGCYNLIITAKDILNLNGTINLHGMFSFCQMINKVPNMDKWDVSRVTDMSWMFEDALYFNQPIGNWNVSSVTNMQNMFYLAQNFNQPIGNWNVSSVTNMQNMFSSDEKFNENIGNWDVSKVTDMSGMFWDVFHFNQPIGNWNVSKVSNMNSMFSSDDAFNQNIGNWNVSKVSSMSSMFSNDQLSITNYSDLLIGWAHLNLQNGVTFDGGSSQYNCTAATARQYIITTFNWTITDGPLYC